MGKNEQTKETPANIDKGFEELVKEFNDKRKEYLSQKHIGFPWGIYVASAVAFGILIYGGLNLADLSFDFIFPMAIAAGIVPLIAYAGNKLIKLQQQNRELGLKYSEIRHKISNIISVQESLPSESEPERSSATEMHVEVPPFTSIPNDKFALSEYIRNELDVLSKKVQQIDVEKVRTDLHELLTHAREKLDKIVDEIRKGRDSLAQQLIVDRLDIITTFSAKIAKQRASGLSINATAMLGLAATIEVDLSTLWSMLNPKPSTAVKTA